MTLQNGKGQRKIPRLHARLFRKPQFLPAYSLSSTYYSLQFPDVLKQGCVRKDRSRFPEPRQPGQVSLQPRRKQGGLLVRARYQGNGDTATVRPKYSPRSRKLRGKAEISAAGQPGLVTALPRGRAHWPNETLRDRYEATDGK